MYNYFVFADPAGLQDLRSSREFLNKFDVKVGGIFPLGTINRLLSIFEFNSSETALRLNPEGPQSFQVYSLPEYFPARLSGYGKDRLENVSAEWAKDEYWEMFSVNPLDLYGFLIELQSLCKTCKTGLDRIICVIVSDSD